MVNDSHNNIIDSLKAIAIVLVVLGHAISYYMNNCETVSVLIELISTLIYSIHVPLFFTIAGYLNREQKIRMYLWKKVKRLLIPYFTFAFLKIVYSNMISSRFAHGLNLGEQIFNAVIIGDYYWFVYTIFFIYLIAPLLWKRNLSDRIFLAKCGVVGVVIIVINLRWNGISQFRNYFQIANVVYYLFFFS